MYKTITISGGFHHASDIRVRVDATQISSLTGKALLWAILERLSPSQRKKIDRHMCGISGCTCGPEHGWQVDW